MTTHIIVRDLYRTAHDVEAGRPYRSVSVGFTPATLSECEVLLTKLVPRKNAIDSIVPVADTPRMRALD